MIHRARLKDERPTSNEKHTTNPESSTRSWLLYLCPFNIERWMFDVLGQTYPYARTIESDEPKEPK